eukprot:CAMPEP_0197639336 /NCGR_PEP_ID=MMETSP1338-20131121/13983_1 /TAXON_ID=43686 ORGANISM="Pelagodinium beii, Strain RCC1491" /NCGR_SAMPLE_ID=MMETSP1338 /ASSEMBLY_ACC=CAM_ASM_000754 /LENGTH=159 /DNA_ID=CAMNT_0043212045 /DNA_START=171 /DNA_END=649 /DNA_ORIENTATION=-
MSSSALFSPSSRGRPCGISTSQLSVDFVDGRIFDLVSCWGTEAKASKSNLRLASSIGVRSKGGEDKASMLVQGVVPHIEGTTSINARDHGFPQSPMHGFVELVVFSQGFKPIACTIKDANNLFALAKNSCYRLLKPLGSISHELRSQGSSLPETRDALL